MINEERVAMLNNQVDTEPRDSDYADLIDALDAMEQAIVAEAKRRNQ